MFYYDTTYILVIIGAILCAIASAHVKSVYSKYDRVFNSTGLTGAMAAERILSSQGVYGVRVVRVAGTLTDHYNPSKQTVALSESTYDSRSIAAIAVAAHECGHVMQHEQGYSPLEFRTALVPVANLGSQLCWPLVLFGLFFNTKISEYMLTAGIAMFCFALLFQVVTLPVEFNASSRAMKIIVNNGMVSGEDAKMARKVLTAAALTYVAAVASSFLNLLRLLIISKGARNDD